LAGIFFHRTIPQLGFAPIVVDEIVVQDCIEPGLDIGAYAILLLVDHGKWLQKISVLH
jgi:hypothetical protein